MTRSYILARKIPWFFILPKINFKLSKVQTLQIYGELAPSYFSIFFFHEKFSYIFKCAELMIWARNLHFWIFRQSINFTKKMKYYYTDMSVWGMSVLLDELVRHLSISTKKGIANFVNAELAQRNCQTDQFFKLWERHSSEFRKLCSTKMFI